MTATQVVNISVALHGVEVDTDRLQALLTDVIADEGSTLTDVRVVLAGHEMVTDLNTRFLGHAFDTDVLAFPDDAGGTPAGGEIYVDVETARERHAEFGSTVAEEVFRYALHGLLHLMGHSDKSPELRKAMTAKEDAYLARAGTAFRGSMGREADQGAPG